MRSTRPPDGIRSDGDSDGDSSTLVCQVCNAESDPSTFGQRMDFYSSHGVEGHPEATMDDLTNETDASAASASSAGEFTYPSDEGDSGESVASDSSGFDRSQCDPDEPHWLEGHEVTERAAGDSGPNGDIRATRDATNGTEDGSSDRPVSGMANFPTSLKHDIGRVGRQFYRLFDERVEYLSAAGGAAILIEAYPRLAMGSDFFALLVGLLGIAVLPALGPDDDSLTSKRLQAFLKRNQIVVKEKWTVSGLARQFAIGASLGLIASFVASSFGVILAEQIDWVRLVRLVAVGV